MLENCIYEKLEMKFYSFIFSYFYPDVPENKKASLILRAFNAYEFAEQFVDKQKANETKLCGGSV